MQKKHPMKLSSGFTHWMLKWRIGDNTQIGILARHIEQDARWPLSATDCDEFLAHLDNINAGTRMKQTMHNAWAAYQDVLKRLNTRSSTRERYNR